MTVWPDKEILHKALSMARDEAAASTGQTITGVCEGEVVNSTSVSYKALPPLLLYRESICKWGCRYCA